MGIIRSLLVAIAFVPSLAAAITMTPYVASQTTCQYCFFPDPIAVIVRDGTLPVPGVPVTFSAATNAYIPNAGLGPWTVLTDSQGIARAPSPGYVGGTFGSSTITASSPAAGSVTFDVTVAGSGPATISIGYNLSLTGMVNQTYGPRFVARVFGADGQPLPNAAVFFGTPGEPGPNVVFEQGFNVGFGQASSLGYAVAPVMTANGTTGRGEVFASTLNNVGIVTFEFTNSAAGVASIEALPGTTPQSARQFALFPEVIGAMVRDAAGNPVKDAAVRFTIPFASGQGHGFFLTEPSSRDEAIVMTGADGRALAPARVLATNPGLLPYTADVPGAGSVVQYDLMATNGAPVRFEVVSGNNQRAIVNTTYPLPWTARAIGADGLPVPYAAVEFFAMPGNDGPTGLFAGRNSLFVMADAQGVAVSPPFTANGVEGSFNGNASGFEIDNQLPFVRFFYENVSARLNSVLVGEIPGNAPVGGTTWAPFSAYVYDKLGQPAAGVGVTWQVDWTCAQLLGQSSYRGVTDGGGHTVSPPFSAIASNLSCSIGFFPDGGDYGVGALVHTFAPESIVIDPSPPSLALDVNSLGWLQITTSADGQPVYYPLSVSITTGKSGATASVDDISQEIGASLSVVRLRTNNKLGTYEVLVRTGPVQISVPVTQKRK